MRRLSQSLLQLPFSHHLSKKNSPVRSPCPTQIDGELTPFLKVSVDTDYPLQQPVLSTRSVPSPFPRSSHPFENQIQTLTPHTVLLRRNGLQHGHRALLHRLRVRHSEIQYWNLGRQHPTSRHALPKCASVPPLSPVYPCCSPTPKPDKSLLQT